MQVPKIIRESTHRLIESLNNYPQFLHVLIGPRQSGKSTAAKQVIEGLNLPYHSITADGPEEHSSSWIEMNWRQALKLSKPGSPALLVVDEMQKVKAWSESIKLLWDEIKDNPEIPIRVLLLGSSSLAIERGLTESLSGRFIVHRSSHWSFSEMKKAHNFSLDQWIYFGGYPGSGSLIQDDLTWRAYILDSLIDTALSRDIMQLEKIAKPALLRALFFLATKHSAEIISYNKLMGLLHDAGNTTTVSHYLELLGRAFLLREFLNIRTIHLRGVRQK
jgi:uncharacterized protein